MRFVCIAICLCATLILSQLLAAQTPAHESRKHVSVGGIYPHLAMWNPHNECGTGAVVPWADKLWAITYAPHYPKGSGDKLYSIDKNLQIEIFEGSVGGTPANRLIHKETNQLVIGPYVIDKDGNVRVIGPDKMVGRLTGTARHLFEPEKKVYYSTMEEGIYEVDLETLQVKELFADYQKQNTGLKPKPRSGSKVMNVPGYHGKGLYSGQGRLIYANNGEKSAAARKDPATPSGCLAQWDGKSEQWELIRRSQFTDVRGPGGFYGNQNPETDPIWAIGWDHRSLILMLLDGGQWHTYRLPKASHCYDGAHGWNTEWPRFKDIGEDDLALNMHGMFWRFPKTFSLANSAGIAPRSTYLKVIGDYTRWGSQLVFGCDDTAKSEFLNVRRAKGKIEPPGQSHSNLWFADPSILDNLGAPLGRGAVLFEEPIKQDTPTDPYLFSGFEKRSVFIVNDTPSPVTFTFEVDEAGNNVWKPLTSITVEKNSSKHHSFSENQTGVWVRVKSDRDCEKATIQFSYASQRDRSEHDKNIFAGLAKPDSKNVSGGLVRVRGNSLKTLAFAAQAVNEGTVAKPKFYELDSKLKLNHVDDASALNWTLKQTQIPTDILKIDSSSVLYIDDDGNRWRLPKADSSFDQPGQLGLERIDREVATERDLFNCHGTFYELPARNAGGFSKIRPICTHNRRIKDYCSYRGLLILSGVESSAEAGEHIIRSDDGLVSLWAGKIDDLWKFSKPVGVGGPWSDTKTQAGQPSDPYLMSGYDQKTIELSHQSSSDVSFKIELDISGTGKWVQYESIDVPADEAIKHEFPTSINAYWIRVSCSANTTVSATLTYN